MEWRARGNDREEERGGEKEGKRKEGGKKTILDALYTLDP